jgi:hypothetical protein
MPQVPQDLRERVYRHFDFQYRKNLQVNFRVRDIGSEICEGLRVSGFRFWVWILGFWFHNQRLMISF